MDSKKLGTLGEKIAARYLEKKGYQILDRNYSSKFVSGPQRGEIDIVAKKGGTISFVEVKTLSVRHKSDPEIGPEEKFNLAKKRKIIKMAESWLMEKKIPFDSKWQIDVISIKINLKDKKAKILYFPNVASE
jgi:putative endonuclease